MANNQQTFLNHLAEKLGRPRRSGVKPPAWNREPFLHLYQEKTQEDLIRQFIEILNQNRTEVDRIHRDQFKQALDKVLNKFQVRSAVFWDDPTLQQLQLEQHLSEREIASTSWNSAKSEQQLRNAAAQVDLGITFADMGLAETGTVVLWNGGGRGRLVSVLPPAYLCILSERNIVPRLTQAVQHIHSQVPEGLPACINFITGPSRTGDIEGDLAIGVHGPGKVHVILLRDE